MVTRRRHVVGALITMIGVACGTSSAAAAGLPGCVKQRWVGAWAAAPSDASRGSALADLFDASANPKSATRNETTRAVLTPTLGGREVRVRLSNRFGAGPVTFAHVTVARRKAGAALVPGTVSQVRFGGRRSVTVPAGRDVVSDPAALRFAAFQALAVDVHVTSDVGKPTEHFTARQTSYLTPEDAGDAAGQVSGAAFTVKTTARPFVTGVDVGAPSSTGAVVAFGDSITDGYQGQPAGVPETPEGIDADGRWPDVLARRLRAAGRRLSVLNLGISGNRVLRDGLDGGNSDTYGPAALNRLHADVLRQAGVTTVIWLEGINDLGQQPNDNAQAVIAGYERGIARLHARGLRVVMGTVTPSGGAANAYGGAAVEAGRQAINAWIRTSGVPDRVVDFDAAVRDPADRTRIDPRYDGSDHLHFNLAGYRAMGEAVRLDHLADARCASKLAVRVSPRRLTAGRGRRYESSSARAASRYRAPPCVWGRLARRRTPLASPGCASARLGPDPSG